MAHWTNTVLLCLHSSLLFTLCKGTIECICTTTECRRDQKASCQASHMCYVQYMPLDGIHGSGPDTSPIVRGCIDERTPLLCENRRPQAYTGSWPVLLCCKEDWCNKDVLPTVPPWLSSFENTDEEDLHIGNPPPDSVSEDDSEEYGPEFSFGDDFLPKSNSQSNSLGYSHHSEEQETDLTPVRRQRARTVNPLYIAVPVAGACVLLAIIIFAIYVLKRQNNYYEDYQYENNFRRQVPPDCVSTPYDSKKTMYVACERSSSGSETKLLMKV